MRSLALGGLSVFELALDEKACNRVDAAVLGVHLHGAAGDIAAEEGLRGLAASDLMPWLRELLG